MLPPVQRLSYLLPSTASSDSKLQEAQRLADDFASKAAETKQGNQKVLHDGIQYSHMRVLWQAICGGSLCPCSQAEATGAQEHQAEAAGRSCRAEGRAPHAVPGRAGAAETRPCVATRTLFQRRGSALEGQQAFLVEPNHRRWSMGRGAGIAAEQVAACSESRRRRPTLVGIHVDGQPGVQDQFHQGRAVTFLQSQALWCASSSQSLGLSLASLLAECLSLLSLSICFAISPSPSSVSVSPPSLLPSSPPSLPPSLLACLPVCQSAESGFISCCQEINIQN